MKTRNQAKSAPSLASSAALMGLIILFSKVVGLLRDTLIASTFGTTEAAIAYETASKLPQTIFDFVLGGVVTAAFIPIYTSIQVKKSREDALSFAYSFLNLILLITGGATVLGILFAPALVSLIAPNLAPSTAELAVELTRICFPMMISVGVAFSFVGFLQSEGEYNIPAVISLVSNCIMVGYLLFFSDTFGIRGLAVSMLLGWAAQAIVQIPAVVKHGYRYRPLSSILTPDIGRAAKNTLPILLSTWATPVCNLVNTSLASGIEEGRAISALGYANRLYIILVGVFSFVATNLLFPLFSRATAEGNDAENDRLTRVSIKILVFILAPISVGVAVLAEPFIALIFEKGSFTPSDTALTGEALRFYAVGMLFAAVCEVLTKAFFAREETRFPMLAALLSMGVNIALLFLFRASLGIGGIALLSGLSAGVNMALSLLFAIRRRYLTPTGRDALELAKSILAALAMGAVVYIVHGTLADSGKLLAFVVPTLAGMAVYAVLTLLLRSEAMRTILKTLTKKG